MSQSSSEDCWQRLVQANEEHMLAFQAFCAKDIKHVPVVRQALHSGGVGQHTALAVIPYLSEAEQLELFGDLVLRASAAHGPVEAVWKLILSLPREWVLAHIEQEVDAILQREQEPDYWLFLQLYDQLDRNLTVKLARRAAAHANPDIRELGKDYLDRLAPAA